jgi:putative transposase
LGPDKEDVMPRKRFISEQIIGKLREAEVALSKGESKKLKQLEKENARLKKLMADMALYNDILREATSGNF